MEKSLTMPKKVKGNPLGFSTFILSQNSKKIKGDPLVGKISKKVAQCRKKLKRDLKSRPVLYETRKKGKTFLVQFPGPTGTI